MRDIKIHPRDNDLIIGTHGRGAWILDDISFIQELSAAMDEEMHLFPVRRATRWESWSRDSNWGASVYQGENPPTGAMIDYWLAEEQPGGVSITINDASGEVVREVRSPGRAGVNRALWNMTWADPPGTVPSPFAAFFGGSGVPALPGTYVATLDVGGNEASESFELRGDPDVALSMADYEAQFETAMKVRDLTGTVNELIRTVDDLNEQVQKVEGQIHEDDIASLETILEQTGTASAPRRRRRPDGAAGRPRQSVGRS